MGLLRNALAGIGAIVIILIIIGMMGSHPSSPSKPAEQSLPTPEGTNYAIRVNYDGE